MCTAVQETSHHRRKHKHTKHVEGTAVLAAATLPSFGHLLTCTVQICILEKKKASDSSFTVITLNTLIMMQTKFLANFGSMSLVIVNEETIMHNAA